MDLGPHEENKLVNDIRRRVAMWRKGGYVGVTPTTTRLIAYWTDPAREKKLFFCQNEALETAIYIAEVAKKYGDAWIENAIREANDTSNPGLPRTAFKMATGSGKTVVMAMLIAWHALNKRANPQDARFSDTFLIITPGITIRDRLRVLLPNDPNYYRQRDIVPAQLHDQLGQAKIIITNYHGFRLRETIATGKLTKSILADGQPSPFTETPDQMVRLPRIGRQEEHRCPTKPITAIAANPMAKTKPSPATIASRPKAARKKPASGFQASRPSKPRSA
jgi:type III restriction enzyme